ncbi:MAG: hypothetical protein EXR07_04905 [Acetobacteraceae bacterium]|nr:hypothetical protein [Acetobacteraceae bacterium]
MGNPLATLVRAHDPDQFLTSLFAPPEHRDALLTLYAFDHELARAREVASEPHLALIRLHWWREVVEGARRRHEVATPLGELIDAGRLSAFALTRIVDAHEAEIEPEIATLVAWRAWLQEGAGGIAASAAKLLGAPDPEIFRPLGAAYGAARVIRWNRRRAMRGRCLLPADLLAARKLAVADAIAEPGSAGVLAVMNELVSEGGRWLGEGPSGRLPRAQIAAALPAVLARRDLRRGTEAMPGPRGLGDRLAVAFAGLTGWL